jgi:hypothetical protein
VLAGFILFGFLLFMKFILSFGGSATPAEMTFAKVAGGVVAVYGILIAVVTWRRAGRPMRLRVDGSRLAIDYRTFSGPFEVSRELVRVVALDPQPRRLFTNNKRFPIAGSVPSESFKDQLDNYPAGPWEDLDPERQGRRSNPAVIWEDMGGDGRRPQGTYSHDEPEQAGWASGGSGSLDAALASPNEAYLWSAHGSSLPFLRIGPGDVPNIAIIFHEPVRAPRTSWWFYLTPSFGGRALVRGGRRMRGVMLAVRNPHAAREAFVRWGIVRQVTAADVVEEGLLVAKPLAGVRVSSTEDWSRRRRSSTSSCATAADRCRPWRLPIVVHAR